MVYKVFISHAYDHSALCDSLVSRFNRERFNWADHSVPRQRRYLADGELLPEPEMKALLKSHIDASDVVIVIAKPIVVLRPYLRWELEYAKKAGKPILAVWRKRVDLKVSKYARDRADRCIDSWQIRSIMKAIEEMTAQSRLSTTPNPMVSADALPDMKDLMFTEELVIPELEANGEPLAPREELALEPNETVTQESPKQALAPALAAGPSPDAARNPMLTANMLEEPSSASGPKPVILATQRRRRWWQFWKSSERIQTFAK